MNRTALATCWFFSAASLLGFAPSALFAEDALAAGSAADLLGVIYWTDRNEGIYRAARDGSEVQLVLRMPFADGLAIDEGEEKLYFTVSSPQQQNADKVMRANLDGSGPQELATLNFTGDLVLDPTEGGKIYVSSIGDGKVVRLNRDGTGLEDFVVGIPRPDELAFDPVKCQLYWTNHGDKRIERANVDGTGRETVVQLKTTQALGIALDSMKREIYWVMPGGMIFRAGLDGSNEKQLIGGLTQPDGLAFDPENRKLYWTENGKLSQANADGSQAEALVLGKTRQYGSIAILPPK